MASARLPRRAATFAAAFGVTAIAGTAPALATVPGENIFGTGSSLSKVAQVNVWTAKWSTTPADHPTLSNNPVAAYDGNGSGHGLDEFGNNTGALDLTQDPTADDASTNGYGVPVLDAWAGSDDPPTGPVTTAGTMLANASLAATGGATTPIDEVTVPVLQAPEAIIMSLPTGITLGAGTHVNLTNVNLRKIWNAGVTASAHYPAHTWGALLENAGLTKVSSKPKFNQFTDAGGVTGGGQGITLQVRNAGSGTTFAFKAFLNLSKDSLYPSSFVNDNDQWPVATVNTGNSGNGAMVSNTTATPGSISYPGLADAATATPGYTARPQTTTVGGTHQILYAQIQANYPQSPAVFASPQGGTVGSANVYTGNNVNINAKSPSFVGHWTVPLRAGTLNPIGTWQGTVADDPDVYDHSLTNGVKKAYYPIVAVTFDLGWTHYAEAGSNLVSDYGGTTAQAVAAGNSAASYLLYAVKGAGGQADLVNAHVYYARLPAVIDSYAAKAASTVHP